MNDAVPEQHSDLVPVLRMILENSREFAIFSTDLDRRITVWNVGAQALLGYTEDEVRGQPADIIFTEEDRAAGVPQGESSQALEHGRVADDRYHQRKDGSRFWASGAMMLMRDAQGQARGFVKILRDQTAERQALEDQREARIALEAADRAKDRFLAVLSHELRNPLASISAAAQMLDAERDSVSAEAAELIRRQSAAMSLLLDDMLDVSRLRLGRLSLHRRPTSLLGIIEGAIQASRLIIEASSHTFEVRLPARDIEVDADPNRLAQVVSNLLANATKYTPNGGKITFDVRLEGSEAVVEVSDNGIGIKAEEVERLFDMFTQAPDALGRSGVGLGIGLTLSRNILDMHGGWIRAASAGPGHGSRFSFGIPALRELPVGMTHGAVSMIQPAGAFTDFLILLADDNQDAVWAVAQLLQQQGFRTLKALDGPSSLAMAEEHHPQVMLVDIGMPGLSGHEVARRVRQRPWAAGVLLIALTGWGQEQDVRASMEAGFDLHLTKPVDMLRLREVIDAHLGKASERGRI